MICEAWTRLNDILNMGPFDEYFSILLGAQWFKTSISPFFSVTLSPPNTAAMAHKELDN